MKTYLQYMTLTLALVVVSIHGFSSAPQIGSRLTRSLPSGSTALFSSNEEDETVSSEAAAAEPPKPAVAVKCPDCDLCDGSGRIEGGIGTILKWWPIKAYRPCPNFIDKGGFYQRSGQGLDEIAFGRDSTYDGQ